LIKFVINSSIGNAMGLAPFEINYRYMPIMMREMREMEKTPPGVQAFAQNALNNMTLAHNVLIEDRIFQQQHTNKRWHNDPKIKINNFIYLSTKNSAMPKGRASKLVPKYVGPYKVMKALSLTSNYELELPLELVNGQIHNRFHVSLLRPHCPNDNPLFPNRKKAQPYNFSVPEGSEWYVNEIISHHWKGRNVELLVKWNLGDSTWEPLSNCNELEALNNYLMLINVKDWQELPKQVTMMSQRNSDQKCKKSGYQH